MNHKPLVSIWMVTYNHEAYIAQAIESVLMQQTDFRYHLYIGEDCSTDNTGAICETYALQNPETITLIRNLKNLGPNKNALNIYDLCFKSGARYMALLEGDDYWTDPLKLQKQVDFLEQNKNCNLCFNRAYLFYENSTFKEHIIPDILNKSEYYYVDLLDSYNFITTASVVIRLFEEFKLPDWFIQSPYGDLTLYFFASKNLKIKCLDDFMSVYRIHDNGLYQKKSIIKRKKQYLVFYDLIYPYLNNHEKNVIDLKRKKAFQEINNLKNKKNLFIKVLNKFIKMK